MQELRRGTLTAAIYSRWVDGAKESRSGVGLPPLLVLHLDKNITQAIGVDLLLVVHGDGGLRRDNPITRRWKGSKGW